MLMNLDKGEKYKLEIVSIGEMAEELFQEGLLIFFADNAPGELKDVSLVHRHSQLSADVVVGDSILIGQQQYTVLAVGKVVNDNLRNLGHMVVKFNKSTTPENAGDINVDATQVPVCTVGTVVTIREE